jgi:hypothetical protein
MLPGGAAALIDRLDLSDDELCAVLDVDPLALIGGDLDHRPELGILLSLTAEAEEQVGAPVLRRWLRSGGSPGARPVDHLLARDFAAFETALAELVRDGFVLRSRG